MRIGTKPLAILLTLVFAGCSPDAEPLVSPSEEGPMFSRSDVESVTSPHQPPFVDDRTIRTLRDEFADMATRIPGGFAGLFLDEEGILTIVLTDAERMAEAKMALADEPFVSRRRDLPSGDRFDVSTARVNTAEFRYDELAAWYRALVVEAGASMTRGSIGVRSNRILIGAPSAQDEANVKHAAGFIGIPERAIEIRLAQAVVPLSDLTGVHRPVPSGIKAVYNAASGSTPSHPTCTLGPNLTRLGQRGFLINSHCTKFPAAGSQDPSADPPWAPLNADSIAFYWQPTKDPFSWTLFQIGNEALDPRPITGCGFVNDRCRETDAAIGLYKESIGSELGKIARPASRNTGELSLHPTTPRFHITVALVDWSLEGEVLEKVGIRTGWSGGQVVDSCVDVPLAAVLNTAILCSMEVEATAGSTDSGAPVFSIISGAEVDLRGMLWGGTPESCTGPSGDLDCTRFYASHLGAIRAEVSPGAFLEFAAPSGGGGNPLPDPCESECPH